MSKNLRKLKLEPNTGQKCKCEYDNELRRVPAKFERIANDKLLIGEDLSPEAAIEGPRHL